MVEVFLKFLIQTPMKLIQMFDKIRIFNVPIYIVCLVVVLCFVIFKKLFGGK